MNSKRESRIVESPDKTSKVEQVSQESESKKSRQTK